MLKHRLGGRFLSYQECVLEKPGKPDWIERRCVGNDWNWIEIKIKSHDENSRVQHVVFNKQNHEVKCICHKFETMEILFKNLLMVFNCMDVTDEKYKTKVNSDFQERDSGGGYVSEMVFVNQIMRSVYDLAQLSKPHEDARKTLYRWVDTAKDEISNLVQNLSLDDETPCDDIPSDADIYEVCIRNPLIDKAKGVTNANITRHWDNKSEKRMEKGKGKKKLKF